MGEVIQFPIEERLVQVEKDRCWTRLEEGAHPSIAEILFEELVDLEESLELNTRERIEFWSSVNVDEAEEMDIIWEADNDNEA